jgi:hypothetical protein
LGGVVVLGGGDLVAVGDLVPVTADFVLVVLVVDFTGVGGDFTGEDG